MTTTALYAAIEAVHDAIAALDVAANGDSNDAEIAAAHELRDQAALLANLAEDRHVKLRTDLEAIAAEIPDGSLDDEDPDTFGAGHLVLRDDSDNARFALTEISDDPENPDRRVTGYTYAAERRDAAGRWKREAAGTVTLAALDTLPAIARAWWANIAPPRA